jgi:drug/metabolite transporter (DMT)-like permease
MYGVHLGTSRRDRAVAIALITVVVAGLAVDAYVHLHLASFFDPNRTSSISQGDLFRVEAALSIVAGLALVLRPRRYTAAFAFLVSAGGLFAVLLYQYVDVGKIGPIPDMYDPVWSTEKAASVVGEAAAALCALVLLVVMQLRARRTTRSSARTSTPVPTRHDGNRNPSAV